MSTRNASARRRPEGIEIRHSRLCETMDGGERCTCQPSYRAIVYDRGVKAHVKKTFSGPGAAREAKAWRAAKITAQERGQQISPSRMTLRQAAEAWLAGAEAEPPTMLTRSGTAYKPSALREYRRNYYNYLDDDLGARPLAEIRRRELNRLVKEWQGRGLSGSKIRNIILVLRVLYREAIENEELEVNPTVRLRLPNGSKPRDRAAGPAEAKELLAVLPDDLRALYATAYYGGLRRGELRALRWEDVDLEGDDRDLKGGLGVRHSWDDVDGEIGPKSGAGERTVPLHRRLREPLVELKAATGRDGHDFVFGKSTDSPFVPWTIGERASRAWKAANEKRAEQELEPLRPIGLHECRHSYSSCLNAVEGIPETRQNWYMGHGGRSVQSDYRHQLEGILAEDAARLDKWYDAQEKKARHLVAVA
jgi:integrase